KGEATTAVLIALLVCLIPTTIGGLLSAIGIAGMDRVLQHNVLAMSGRAVEAAGDGNVLLLDQTRTITPGKPQATDFLLPPRAPRRPRLRPRRRGAAVLARRRDPRGPVDRRARQGAVRPARPPRRGHALHPLLRDDADVRRRLERAQHPQGRGGLGHGV